MIRAFLLGLLTLASLPLAATAGGPVRGLLVDETDGAALPFYKVEVQSSAGSEKVTSDAKGRFATTRAFDAGEVKVLAIDCDALKRSTYLGRQEVARLLVAPKKLDFDPAKELTVALAVGPTYRFRLSPMPATLPEGAFARLWAEPVAGAGDVWSVVAPLRSEGGGVWARFDQYPKYVAQASTRWMLGVEVPSGLWSGSAPVTSIRGEHEAPIELAMTERARWSGKLHNQKGAPVAQVWLTLTRLGDSGQRLATIVQATDWDGLYSFPNLEPGAYELAGAPLRHHEFKTQPRTLAALEDAKLDVGLDPIKSAGAIAGRLESRSGTYSSPQGTITLILRRAGDPLALERKTPEWTQTEGKKSAAFSFDDLPAGEYEVEVIAPNTVPFEPLMRTAKAPAADVVFVAQDG